MALTWSSGSLSLQWESGVKSIDFIAPFPRSGLAVVFSFFLFFSFPAKDFQFPSQSLSEGKNRFICKNKERVTIYVHVSLIRGSDWFLCDYHVTATPIPVSLRGWRLFKFFFRDLFYFYYY